MKLPNWKNKEEYKYIDPDKIGKAGVAWEFLRRSKDFRADLKSLKDGTVVDDAGNPPIVRDEPFTLFSTTEIGFYSPKRKMGESDHDWRDRCLDSGVTPRFLSPEQYILDKWLVKGGVPNPDLLANDPTQIPTTIPPQVRPRIILTWEKLQNLDLELPIDTQEEIDEFEKIKKQKFIYFHFLGNVSNENEYVEPKLIDDKSLLSFENAGVFGEKQLPQEKIYVIDENVESDLPPVKLSKNNIVVTFNLNEKTTPQWGMIKDRLNKLHEKYLEKIEGKENSDEKKFPKKNIIVPYLRVWDSYKTDPQIKPKQRTKVLYMDNSEENLRKMYRHYKRAKEQIFKGC